MIPSPSASMRANSQFSATVRVTSLLSPSGGSLFSCVVGNLESPPSVVVMNLESPPLVMVVVNLESPPSVVVVLNLESFPCWQG